MKRFMHFSILDCMALITGWSGQDDWQQLLLGRCCCGCLWCWFFGKLLTTQNLFYICNRRSCWIRLKMNWLYNYCFSIEVEVFYECWEPDEWMQFWFTIELNQQKILISSERMEMQWLFICAELTENVCGL